MFGLKQVDKNKSRILFIGLNPSTANEIKNDPTVSRMINLAKRLNYGSVTVCNLFGFRATFPEDLKKADDPVGKENNLWLQKEINSSDEVIACWGNHGKFLERGSEVSRTIHKSVWPVWFLSMLKICFLSKLPTLVREKIKANLDILKILTKASHFGLTKQGEPRHILYLKRNPPLFPF